MTEQARLYGTVLYELKVPEKMVRETGRIFQENPELKAVLDDPTLQETKKEAIIGKIWKEPDFSSTMVHFLKKACEEGCIGQMEDMIKVWEKCLLDGAGILSASLFYVTRPDEEQLAGIREFLCREYKKKDVQLEMAAAPELMGGFVLKTGDVEYDYSDSVEQGNVISQSPSANASASEGDTVTITVSQGKKVSYAKMPNVLGLTEDAAKQAIKDQGLVPSVTYQSTSGTYGLVTAQGYNSGESLESGTTVTIVVSHYQKATEPATTAASQSTTAAVKTTAASGSNTAQ